MIACLYIYINYNIYVFALFNIYVYMWIHVCTHIYGTITAGDGSDEKGGKMGEGTLCEFETEKD